MKQSKIILALCACIFLFTLNSYAQNAAVQKMEVTNVFERLKSLSSYGYDYHIAVRYPNGTGQSLEGKAFLDYQNKLMYNQSDAFEMLYTDEWFYRAEHASQTVTVMNLDKHYKTGNKAGIQQDYFSNQLSAGFIDSIVLKYGKVKSFRKRNDTLFALLDYSSVPHHPLKKIVVVYDTQNQLPVSLEMQLLYSDGGGKGIKQTVKCQNYTVGNRGGRRLSEYFTVVGNRVQLKRYKNYHLKSSL